MNRRRALLALTLLALPAAVAGAQTDFYNTDRARPLRTEDAIVVERRAFELQLAPLTITRVGSATLLALAPELAWGLAPRTQVELALPIHSIDTPGAPATTGLAGVELALLHQLNAETMSLPAFALGFGAHLPAGPQGPPRALPTLRAIATRTSAWGRVHLNADYTFGERIAIAEPGLIDASRWSAGLAVDHTFPLRSLLVGAELVAEQDLRVGSEGGLRAALGLRKQLSPRVALDFGANRDLTGELRRWSLTAGAAYAFAPRWMPGFVRGTR